MTTVYRSDAGEPARPAQAREHRVFLEVHDGDRKFPPLTPLTKGFRLFISAYESRKVRHFEVGQRYEGVRGGGARFAFLLLVINRETRELTVEMLEGDLVPYRTAVVTVYEELDTP